MGHRRALVPADTSLSRDQRQRIRLAERDRQVAGVLPMAVFAMGNVMQQAMVNVSRVFMFLSFI